jgi:hypothetical protein
MIQKTLIYKTQEYSEGSMRPSSQHPIVVDYFYNARAGEQGTSHKMMLRSLLYQALDQEPAFLAFISLALDACELRPTKA